MKKYLHILSFITLTLTTLLMAYVLYSYFWPFNIIDIKSTKILTPIIYRGELLKYELDYCKYKDISGISSRAFINGLIYTMPTVKTNLKIGCNKKIMVIIIPIELPVGKYALRIIYEYKINSLKTIIGEHMTNQFEVR